MRTLHSSIFSYCYRSDSSQTKCQCMCAIEAISVIYLICQLKGTCNLEVWRRMHIAYPKHSNWPASAVEPHQKLYLSNVDTYTCALSPCQARLLLLSLPPSFSSPPLSFSSPPPSRWMQSKFCNRLHVNNAANRQYEREIESKVNVYFRQRTHNKYRKKR